jgi:hypothetical protein
MALIGFPPNAQQVGSIEIALYLTEDGTGTAYGLDGVTPEAAIGYLTIVTDRLREERSLQWDTCPGCGLPYDECAERGEDDDEAEDEDMEDDD